MTWYLCHRSDLSLGQRAADAMRNGMGSWPFVLLALVFLVAWMVVDGFGVDPFPWILLNLVLSCVAALQGAVLLIAAKRADEVSAVLTMNDHEVNVLAERRIEELQGSHAEILRSINEIKVVVMGGRA